MRVAAQNRRRKRSLGIVAPPPGASLEARAALVTSAAAWSYLSALSRREFEKATALLIAFRMLWNEHRDAIVGFMAERVRAAAPPEVPVLGDFDRTTGTAMLVTFSVTLSPPLTHDQIRAFPTEGPIGPLIIWHGQVSGSIPAAHFSNLFEETVTTTAAADLVSTITGLATGYVLGLEEPPPPPPEPAPPEPPPEAPPPEPAPIEPAPKEEEEIIPGEEFEVPGRRFVMPLWGWLAIGGGVLVGGGVLLWYATKRAKKRGR